MTDTVATVFLSYAHADKPLARAIKAGLDARGCRVWIDEGELKIGESLYDSIAAALDQVDFVAALMSPTSIDSNWCQKEISLAMSGEVSKHGVTVLPLRIGGVALPATLRGKKYLDVDPEDIASAVDEIMSSIRRYLNPPAPLPPRRRPAAPTSTGARVAALGPHGPLHIVGVDRDGITKPLGDGTPGSALYAVPLELSATPDPVWAGLFVQNWDRPPSFSTMHRPGIARVTGNRIVLDGTTVDEIAQYHRRTLDLAVDVTNQQHAEHVRREQAARHAQDAADLQHQEDIDRALGSLTFAKPDTADLRTMILKNVERAEQDPGFSGLLSLDVIAEAVGQPRHLVKAEIIRVLDDRLIRCSAPPSEDFGGGYHLVQPMLTTAGQRFLRDG